MHTNELTNPTSMAIKQARRILTAKSVRQSAKFNEVSIMKTVKIKNELTEESIKDADIYYYAGESCSLGKTDSTGKLVTTFPLATGGFIHIKKEGYLDYFLHEKDFSEMQNIMLKPLFKKKLLRKSLFQKLMAS